MKTANDFRNDAAAKDKEAFDSFERCDTDGFLSQWANGINAQLDRAKAAIVEDGKTAIFAGLFEGSRRIKARTIKTKFGTAWLLHEDEVDLIERRGKKFLPFGTTSRIHKDLGIRQGHERAPAWAVLASNGTGLSGNVWVQEFRTGDKWGMDATEETDDAPGIND